MKLPTDYQIPSLGDLKRVVVLMATGREEWNETLEMTKEQYGRYKELVWREDPIRFYNGMEIRIAPLGLQDVRDNEKQRGGVQGQEREAEAFHVGEGSAPTVKSS